MKPTSPLSLALSGRHHADIYKHLFPGDGNEAVALLLCGRSRNNRRDSLLVREVIPVPYQDCRIRTPYRVTWSVEAMTFALERAMNLGLAVVKVHSHPGSYNQFSDTDDVSDTELFSSIFGWLATDDSQASVVMLPDGSMFGREINLRGIGAELSGIRVAGDDFSFWGPAVSTHNKELPNHACRIAQMFGKDTYQKLKSLRIGVVGNSGTGSVVIEQLARNCVGELVLVDPEDTEHKNLNRILNSTLSDANAATPKVDVMKRAVSAIGMGTKVTTYKKDLMNTRVLKALSSCDVLVGCMDSVDGRHILNKLASYYLIPYVDVGVRIDADGVGGVSNVCGVVHTLQPGGSSLMSRGMYDQAALSAAMLQRSNPKAYAERLKEGYIKGICVDQPAVISLNMQIAATAVNELLARLHPYRVESNGNYAVRRVVLSDPAASCDGSDGPPCPLFSKWVGLGDRTPYLGYPELEVEEASVDA